MTEPQETARWRHSASTIFAIRGQYGFALRSPNTRAPTEEDPIRRRGSSSLRNSRFEAAAGHQSISGMAVQQKLLKEFLQFPTVDLRANLKRP